MAMMHLRFPKKAGFFSWDELGLMARALGFAAETFSKCLPDDIVTDEPGLKTKLFLNMVNDQKFFHIAINCSFNVHTDEWNVCVINKAVALLDSRIISFDELLAVRVAFQVYEASDTKGMRIDDKILQRALKVDDFDQVLQHYDERLAQKLNREYLQDEWAFSKEKHGSRPMPRDVPPVDPGVREQMVNYHNDRYKALNYEVRESEQRVYRAQAGLIRDRPVNSPDLLMYEYPATSRMAVSTLASHRPTVMQTFGSIICPGSCSPRLTSTASGFHGEFVRPKRHDFQRPNTVDVVTPADFATTAKDVEALKFEMETIEMKYTQQLRENMDFVLPGYRGRKVKRAKTEVETPTAVTPKAKARQQSPLPCRDPISRLVSQPSEVPVAHRGKARDARLCGSDKAKADPHAVLMAPPCNKCERDILFNKTHKNSSRTSNRTDVVSRHKSDTSTSLSRRRELSSSVSMEMPHTPHTPTAGSGRKRERAARTPHRSLEGLPSVCSTEPKRRMAIRGVRINEPEAQFWLSLQDKRPPSDEGSVLQKTSNEAFQRLCSRAVDAGSKRLYQKLILSGM
ncbi:hypothetical protein CAPTEDRAFT_220241 [Capitella teleta]|uniref:Uncharacterized protein n=1 Tax=Capitella teleta TaxID=283909 RepID=R7TTJ7_CAPTE|nr:hypothetical protein CAPTEDRAFT_220241 [Capitella teleta]|eukprot:ELT94310.1 hypothetical protein CAPTEDRAFT_220241 [Capitella teleta]